VERVVKLVKPAIGSPDDPAQLAAAVDPAEVPLACRLLQRWCYDLLSLRLVDQVRYNPDYAAKLRGLADKVAWRR
jgi:hypothetical protein